jgi:hypothetical protein
MSNPDRDRKLRVFILIPIFANLLTIFAAIVLFTRDGRELAAILLLALGIPAAWGMAFLIGRLVDVFLDSIEGADDGIV